VDGDRIKNEKLGRCLSTTMKIDKLLLRCEVEENSHKSNAIANRKMRIEGNEVKNYSIMIVFTLALLICTGRSVSVNIKRMKKLLFNKQMCFHG
jgi:hypothetical protein